MKQWLNLTVILLLSACGGGDENKDTTTIEPDKHIETNLEIVQKEQGAWLKSLPRKDLLSYGFVNSNEFNQTRIGEPLKVYALSVSEINSYQNVDDFKIGYLNEIKYPIIIDKQIRSMLTFSTKSNKVIRLGEAKIANQLNSIENYLSTTKGLDIVMVFEESAPLLFIWQNSFKRLIPLYEARKALKIDENLSDISTLDIDKMIPILKEYYNKEGV